MEKKLSSATTPRVSVIIPVYNCDRYIQEAIESVLNQTYSDYEIIVVDDGSTDNTRSVLEPYFHRIHYIYQENQGASAARNRGLQEARGKFVAFLDADDFFLLPSKLAEQVACFEAQPRLGVVHSGWRMVNQQAKKMVDREPWHNAPKLDLKTWIVWIPVFLGAMMFRRDWLERVGGFDSRFRQSEDVDIIFRLALMGCEFAWLQKIVVGYRQHNSNTSGQTHKEAKFLDAVIDNFFYRTDLPDQIHQLEQEVRYTTRVWLAWCFYRNGKFSEMAQYLQKSLSYTPQSLTETIAYWIEFFTKVASEHYGYKLNIHSLSNCPEWQQLLHYILIDKSPQTMETSSTCNEKTIINKKTSESKESSNYPRKINLNLALNSSYGTHRSGLLYALDSLRMLHNNQGILLDGFIEKKFAWDLEYLEKPEPYQEPWIGIICNSPKVPRWFDYSQAPQSIFATKLWQDSIKYCQGLFCFSEYHKRWLNAQLDLPIVSLILATETPDVKFSPKKFLSNHDRKIVQVGWWLRKLHSIYYLPVKKMKKAILKLNRTYIDKRVEAEKIEFYLKPDYNSVEIINGLPDDEYDELLSQNIVYLDLYDTCSNNALVECIVRNTPVLVNPLPAVKEYLGEDYPLYFESRREAAKKAEDFALIEETYNYLKFHPIKEKLTADYFLNSFAESEIYKQLSS